MFDNIKKFLKKIIFNNGIKNNNNNNDNQNNINNNTMINVIKPGHYCSIETNNSDVKEIIRIIGPNKNREGYWLTDDNKQLHESMILNSYIPLYTTPIEENKKIKVFDIMSGFKPINTDIETEEVETTPQQIPQVPQVETTPQQIPQPTINNELNDTENLIRKAHINSLNKNSEKIYGTKPYKPTRLNISIDIEIPYDINKLLQLSELFDIDKKRIINFLLSNIELPKTQLHTKINDLFNTITTQQNITEQPKNESTNSNELTLGMAEIEDYIQKLK